MSSSANPRFPAAQGISACSELAPRFAEGDNESICRATLNEARRNSPV